MKGDIWSLGIAVRIIGANTIGTSRHRRTMCRQCRYLLSGAKSSLENHFRNITGNGQFAFSQCSYFVNAYTWRTLS